MANIKKSDYMLKGKALCMAPSEVNTNVKEEIGFVDMKNPDKMEMVVLLKFSG